MGKRLKLRIFDSVFTPWGKSASLMMQNANVSPTYFDWTTDDTQAIPGINVYTDGHIKDADRPGAIAWLLEPKHLRMENYEQAKQNAHKFDLILTYDKTLLDSCDNAKFYPFGGSAIPIEKWGMYPKTKDICMIMSDKNTMPGHKLRHAIAKDFGDRIDVFGSGVGKPFDDKFEILKDYKFAVIVESGQANWYFTEKLIDCLSVGTIPIYWGCQEIGRFFGNIIQFPNVDQLQNVLDLLGSSLFNHSRMQNHELAKRYRVCDDHIYQIIKDHYGL